ncbi:MAG: aromatic ring-hydroxylating dioxygenase subunit alpha [Pseudomonadales bacterium]
MNQNLIPLADLERVQKPGPVGSGLPNAAYSSSELFEFERDHVLGVTWAGLAFYSDVPVNGSLSPIDFMGLPLLVTRNLQGEVNVFHNVCSHRGMPLVAEAQTIDGLISCRYHCWSYDLNGQLKGAPHVGGVGKHTHQEFDRSLHGLKIVRSHVWMGLVYINLSGDADGFDTFIAPLLARWEAFTGVGQLEQVTLAATGSQIKMEVAANWKLPVENYCESYHLPWVHPGLNSYSPLDQHYNIIAADGMSGQGSLNYNLAGVAGTKLPQFHQWPSDKISHSEYLSLYPNVLLGVQADHVFTVLLQPLANDRTLERIEIYYVGEEALTDKYQECRESVLRSWNEVFSEDIFAVEGMQEGRRSPAFTGGVFTPVLDQPTRHFHSWVANLYSAAS